MKAQLAYHAASAEALNAIQGDIEELMVAAEGDYRYLNQFSTRPHDTELRHIVQEVSRALKYL